jgi:glyoxylate carboligase
VIESALSIIVAGLFGYWHAFYAWVIGLSVITAAFFLASHKTPLRITRQNGDAADSVPLIWTHFAATGIFIAVNVCFLAADFSVYFFVAWLH